MKKLLCLYLIMFSCNLVFSQNIKGGLIAGISTSQVSGDNLGGFDKAGFTAGALAKTTLSEKLDFEIELLYVQKGSKKNINPDKNDYVYYKLQLNYVEVPIMIKYKFSDKWIFDAGLSYGRLVHSSEEDEYGEFPESIPFKKDEFSVNGGLNYFIFKNIVMNWRLSQSVLPIRPHSSGAQYRLNRGQFNTVLMFLLKYEFGGKEN